jgi:hypothetical protein
VITEAPGLALVFRYQFANFGHKIMRHVHDGFRRLDTSLIFGHAFGFGLLLIVRKHPPYPVFIPPMRKLVLTHCCFFFLRLRYATSAFPVSS